jgi:hypothetical protein
LQSVLEQKLYKLGMYVNDGSLDNAIAEDWCVKDKRFRMLKENGGSSSARNAEP